MVRKLLLVFVKICHIPNTNVVFLLIYLQQTLLQSLKNLTSTRKGKIEKFYEVPRRHWQNGKTMEMSPLIQFAHTLFWILLYSLLLYSLHTLFWMLLYSLHTHYFENKSTTPSTLGFSGSALPASRMPDFDPGIDCLPQFQIKVSLFTLVYRGQLKAFFCLYHSKKFHFQYRVTNCNSSKPQTESP